MPAAPNARRGGHADGRTRDAIGRWDQPPDRAAIRSRVAAQRELTDRGLGRGARLCDQHYGDGTPELSQAKIGILVASVIAGAGGFLILRSATRR